MDVVWSCGKALIFVRCRGRVTLRQAQDRLFLCWPKEKVTKKKGPPRQNNPATGCTFGIFVLAIHGSVRKRRPSMAAALRVWIARWLFV
jgi:hypothetical protein